MYVRMCVCACVYVCVRVCSIRDITVAEVRLTDEGINLRIKEWKNRSIFVFNWMKNVRPTHTLNSDSLSLSLSHTHTQTHTCTHRRTHTRTHTHIEGSRLVSSFCSILSYKKHISGVKEWYSSILSICHIEFY